MSNEVKELLEDVKYVISETLNDEWATAVDQRDFKTRSDYAPYGDTFVSTGGYITDEDDTKFREEFISENTPDELIQKLILNPDFKNVLGKLVREYAYDKELEV